MSRKVYVPGKIVLSGEHAVVYGAPAIAMAVNRYVVASVSPQLLPIISFDLSDVAYEHGLTLHALRRLKRRIKQQYARFVTGECRIRDVLRKSHELAQFAFTLFVESLNLKLSEGVRIRLQSDIPVGCGMGSSAATILGVSHALAHHLQMQMAPDFFLRLGLEAEMMQHGRSSGLDLQICQQGGYLLTEENKTLLRPVPNFSFYLVNTGTPSVSTGECVTQVAPFFAASQRLLDEFTAVTRAFDQALYDTTETALAKQQAAVRENHALLVRIGVVPPKVQSFISEIERMQSAAKICGAGAVAGETAGMVLVLTQDPAALAAICARYHYAILPVTGENCGVRIV